MGSQITQIYVISGSVTWLLRPDSDGRSAFHAEDRSNDERRAASKRGNYRRPFKR